MDESIDMEFIFVENLECLGAGVSLFTGYRIAPVFWKSVGTLFIRFLVPGGLGTLS